MGRRLRSILPSTNAQLTPQTVNIKNARQKMREMQVKSKGCHDKRAKPLSKLKVGQPVTIQKGKIWEPAKVVSQYNDHSFNVETSDGGIYRRNRRFLNTIGEKSGQQNTQNQETQNSQVLPEIKSPCEPQNISVKSPEKIMERETILPSDITPVVTRSGREVKPSTKYAGDEWTK